MDSTKRPTIWMGAAVGLLLTAPVMAIFFLADRLAGLPFVPFDLFDFLGKRVLPGDVLTRGIDAMVDTIIALRLGETSSAAKTIEQLIALAVFLVAGAIAGIAYFALAPRLRRRLGDLTAGNAPGLVMGGAVGVIMVLISWTVNVTATVDPMVGLIWIVAVFLGWGAALSQIYRDLSALPVTAKAGEMPRASVSAINRRQFIVRVGGATATLTVIGAGLGALLGRAGATETRIADSSTSTSASDGAGNTLPNADDPLQPAPGTRPEYTPLDDHYRIDISARPPVIGGETWKLPITGLVENPVELTLNDLRNNYEPTHQYITLACISNRIGGDLTSTTRWTGVSLQKILEQIKPTGSFLRITSEDGFDEILDLQVAYDDPRVMLTYEWDGQPLKQQHGFPLRIYIPDRYGMKQPKWITAMEVIAEWEEGYWVRRGWSKEAMMNATSVVDTVAADALIQDGQSLLVPVGGIAHAGARGISKVEVKVDDGEWVEAKLRSPLSETTWVIWRYDWPFEEGPHTFRVRCTEGDGTPQIETERGVRPDGATGIHSMYRNLQKPAGSA